MLGKANTFFTCSKATVKRVSSLVVAVFMLQVVAAGFCATMVHAEPVKQVSAMAHCSASSMHVSGLAMSDMQMADMGEHSMEHACSHCDMPDINISFDKTTFSPADLAADMFVVALVLTPSEVDVATFTDAPPYLSQLRTNLHHFNLNLRIRV